MRSRLLLDTHVVVYTVTGAKLTREAKRAIEGAAHDGLISVADISIWELAMYLNDRRIKINTSAESWIDHALAALGASAMPVSSAIAVESVALALHGDPADRIIAATAIVHGMTLVTRDAKILEHAAETKRLRTIEA